MASRSPSMTRGGSGRGRISRERLHVLPPLFRRGREFLFLMHCRPLAGLTWSYCPWARRRRLLTSFILLFFFGIPMGSYFLCSECNAESLHSLQDECSFVSFNEYSTLHFFLSMHVTNSSSRRFERIIVVFYIKKFRYFLCSVLSRFFRNFLVKFSLIKERVSAFLFYTIFAPPTTSSRLRDTKIFIILRVASRSRRRISVKYWSYLFILRSIDRLALWVGTPSNNSEIDGRDT